MNIIIFDNIFPIILSHTTFSYLCLANGSYMNTQIIIDRIEYYRKERGLTQKVLAEAANMTLANLSRFLTGKTKSASITFLQSIADALQVDIVELLRTPEELAELVGPYVVTREEILKLFDQKENNAFPRECK